VQDSLNLEGIADGIKDVVSEEATKATFTAVAALVDLSELCDSIVAGAEKQALTGLADRVRDKCMGDALAAVDGQLDVPDLVSQVSRAVSQHAHDQLLKAVQTALDLEPLTSEISARVVDEVGGQATEAVQSLIDLDAIMERLFGQLVSEMVESTRGRVNVDGIVSKVEAAVANQVGRGVSGTVGSRLAANQTSPASLVNSPEFRHTFDARIQKLVNHLRTELLPRAVKDAMERGHG
jgi:hypothetical protein